MNPVSFFLRRSISVGSQLLDSYCSVQNRWRELQVPPSQAIFGDALVILGGGGSSETFCRKYLLVLLQPPNLREAIPDYCLTARKMKQVLRNNIVLETVLN